MQNAIDAYYIGKKYPRFNPARPRTVGEVLANGLRWFRPTDYQWALTDVHFSVPTGRVLGVLGANGAGKSTLLRLLGGVLQPDVGELYIRGRVGALVDLGAGFHPDLTGRENIFLSGVIAGLTRREVAARLEEIVEFAELAAHIDDPLRTYSNGMQMRLAFAVASHIDPDILLIDEVLAVGDLAFQEKCLARIQQFKAQGCTIVLVTHDPGLVERFCDEALWLNGGRVAAQGEARGVAGQYVAAMQQIIKARTPTAAAPATSSTGSELKLNENRWGSLEMTITGVEVMTRSGQPQESVAGGAAVTIRIRYTAPIAIAAPIFGLSLVREDGVVCYESSTQATGLVLPTVTGTGEVSLEIERLDLAQGRYHVDVGIYAPNWAYAYDYHWHVYALTVQAPHTGNGVLQPPHQWHLHQTNGAASPLHNGALPFSNDAGQWAVQASSLVGAVAGE